MTFPYLASHSEEPLAACVFVIEDLKDWTHSFPSFLNSLETIKHKTAIWICKPF
jgi:hypothetical protein